MLEKGFKRGAGFGFLVIALGLLLALPAFASQAKAAEDEAAWQNIRDVLFDGQDIQDGTGVIHLEAPDRAEDAAIVPIKISAEIPQTQDLFIKKIHLLIDENPAPIAGVFHMTPDSGIATIATRVRVNAYTYVRAIAEMSDGALYMAKRFVKASGGCSAPALKDHESAMARLGKMKLKPLSPYRPGEPNQLQLMISHPNYSGLQIDQISRNWVPPHFIEQIDIRFGERTIMSVEGDISLSENPSIRFSFVPDQPGEIGVRARDTEGDIFSQSWSIGTDAGA